MRTIVFCHDHPAGAAFDPNAAETEKRDVELVGEPSAATFAAVGWRSAGLRAAALAATHPERVDRLVLCCVPAPFEDRTFDPGGIAAKTLLLYGQLDEETPFAHAKWWKEHLPAARVEMVPGRGSDIIDVMWKRILSHAAPNTLRSGS